MKTISRYIMTLALLLTAVGGAWAAETTVTWVTTDFYGTGSAAFTKKDVTVTPGNNDARHSNFFYANGANTFTTTLGNFTKIEIVFMPSSSPITISGWDYELIEAVQPEPEYEPNYWQYTSKLTWTGDAESVSIQGLVESILSITFTIAKPDVEVTTNAAEEGGTFTEAWFNMPANDATADYELVRDMSIQMTATMGDGTDGVRYRVKKAQQGEGYEPADMDMMQVLALVAVNDGIEQKALTLNQDYYCRIYKLDEQTHQPEGDGVKLTDFDFAPGLYALKAVAKVGSDYDGETDLSNTFQLFQGYEITVPAGEFVTYYKDEPLRIEDQEADLYTIQSVSADQAVLSSPSDAMPALTPMLIYNKSQQEKVILLIPCAEPDLTLTVAPEFQGTLTGTTIAASTENQTNYALNGKAFVFVKNAIEVGPNKAWLSINTGVPSARITLVFDETTKITNTNITNITNGNWYDLNGRKLDKMPTKKGVYIMNGRKVVVK